jgi:hypothetical protein
MELAMIIPPFRTPYGLKLYTCPKCGRSEDYLVEPGSKAAWLREQLWRKRDESSGRIRETCARLPADGKICARSAEQGDLAAHGGEMAPLCGEIRQQPSARDTPGAAEAAPDVCGELTRRPT